MVGKTSTREGRGWAPAKLILFGEHAVAYGAPALGIALSRGVSAELHPGSGLSSVTLPEGAPSPAPGGPGPEDLVLAVLGEARFGLDVKLDFEVPPQGGLGTSAALATALMRAQRALEGETGPEDELRVFDEAVRVESLAHGRSSGLDPALVLHGTKGPVWFRLGENGHELEILQKPPGLTLVVGMLASHGGTLRSVGLIAEFAKTQPTLHRATIEFLGALATEAKDALAGGDHARLGRSMNLAHGVLQGLGLVSASVADLVRRAQAASALGVKMTGAGGAGGAVFALAEDRASAERVQGSWREAGAFAWIETLGG